MLPAVRLYWVVALGFTPLCLVWLLFATSGSVAPAALGANPVPLISLLLGIAYTALGAYELWQPRSNLKRNYPVLANLRYLLEYIRPEIQQYFIANNTEERPFNREQRNVIYRRAKGLNDTIPFGTEHDITV